MEPKNNSFGIVTGTATALAFPESRADWARIRNDPNGTLGYIGTYGGASYPLDVGDDTGWFSLNNMSDLYYKGTGTHFSYWFQN